MRKAEKERIAAKVTDNHLTPAKIQRLKDDLKDLKEVQRPDAKEKMQAAALDGDFSENAAYQDAKWRLRKINTRILSLTERINHAIPIEQGTDATGAISIGSTVVVSANGKTHTFEVVGVQEANPSKGRISHLSPLGSMLLDRYEGDDVVVLINDEEVIYHVEEVR
jgi:transcription elongation GreA/GreB family factor